MSAPIPHRASLLVEIERARACQSKPVQWCDDFETDAPLFTRFELVVLTLVGVAAVVLFVASNAGMLP